MTLEEFADAFVEWANGLDGVRGARRVTEDPTGIESVPGALLGHEFMGLTLDGLPVSVEFSFTE